MPLDVYTALSALVRAEATRSAAFDEAPDARPSAAAASDQGDPDPTAGAPGLAADVASGVAESDVQPPATRP